MIGPIQPSKFIVESNGNLGSVEIAIFIGLVLFGIALSQGYTYFRLSGDCDGRFRMQLMVIVLLTLEFFHSFTAATSIYYDSVTKWKSAQPNSYPLSTNALLETLTTLIVQCFFSFRIYKLSSKLLISITCFTLAVLRFIAGVAAVVELFLDVPNVPNGTGVVVRISWLITSVLSCGAAADVLIAATMTYYLHKLASPFNSESTSNLLNRLIRFALQTGLITSMTSVAVIIFFQCVTNMVWVSLYMILAKLYSNSLLVALNARPRLEKSKTVTDLEKNNPITDIQFAPIPVSFLEALHANDRHSKSFLSTGLSRPETS
jgi:hypothetical protein